MRTVFPARPRPNRSPRRGESGAEFADSGDVPRP
jgi:hypothetical protein